MATNTPRVGLYMPADDGSEPIDVAIDLNDNLEKIDSALGFAPATSSVDPTNLYDGKGAYETDTGRVKFRKGGVWSYLLSAGSSFLSNVVLDTAYRFGIGTASPGALFDLIVANITSVPVLRAKQASDSFYRIQLDSDGLRFGSGTVATDTRIYRQAANTLAFTGAVSMENNLSVVGSLTAGSANISGDLNVDGNVVGDMVVTGTFSGTGIGVPRIVRKIVDTSRASTTTMSNDPELLFAVEANSLYWIELFLIYSGDAAADIKGGWSIPANAAGYVWALGQPATQPERDTTTMKTGVYGMTTDMTLGCTGATWWNGASHTGYLTTDVAGTVNFRWAQFASNAIPTVVRIGSMIKITKLA